MEDERANRYAIIQNVSKMPTLQPMRLTRRSEPFDHTNLLNVFHFDRGMRLRQSNAIIDRLPLSVQRFNAVHAVTYPVPTAGAPMKIGIEIDIHAGSIRVFSRISRLQFGHFADDSRM
jgi:hypothetical protein